MNPKAFEWTKPPILFPHSRRKLKVLGEYTHNYLLVRCRNPRVRKFRIAIVDAFAGGGYYKCGSLGSPLVFLSSLSDALKEVNLDREIRGIETPVQLECHFLFNDLSPVAINELKIKYNAEIQLIDNENFFPTVEFFNSKFEDIYPKLKEILQNLKFKNVIFNLDQCGTTSVNMQTLYDISVSFKSPEIFLTFMIGALERFFRKNDPDFNIKTLKSYNLNLSDIEAILDGKRDIDTLANVENLLLDKFRSASKFISPFAVENPKGYSYWMIHLSKQAIARVTHNNVLHDNATYSAHFGDPGIRKNDMLRYDPREENKIYLFSKSDREDAREELMYDIPNLVYKSKNPIQVGDFLSKIYNETPATQEDLLLSLLNCPDIEIKTDKNRNRRATNTIKDSDHIVCNSQKSFFFFNSKDFSTKLK